MNIRTFIFTYSGDQDLILGKIENSLWAFPGMPIHVIDDRKSPMDYEIVDQITKLDNVTYELSNFNRMGNLNGSACIKEELSIFTKYAKFNEIIIKTDPDALFISKQLADFITKGIGFLSCQVIDHVFSGYFYAMHSDVLSFVSRWLMPNNSILKSAPEDATIGATACACALMLGYRNDTIFDGLHNGRADTFDYSVPKDKEDLIVERICEGAYLMYLGVHGIEKNEVVRIQRKILDKLKEVKE